jgi:hypothetical protein
VRAAAQRIRRAPAQRTHLLPPPHTTHHTPHSIRTRAPSAESRWPAASQCARRWGERADLSEHAGARAEVGLCANTGTNAAHADTDVADVTDTAAR